MIRRLTKPGRRWAATWGHHTLGTGAGFKSHPSPAERRRARHKARADALRLADRLAYFQQHQMTTIDR